MAEDDQHTEGVVLPLDPSSSALTTTDPWRVLAEERGILVTWGEAPATNAEWGTALRGGSALAQQLGSIVSQAGQSRALSTGQTLFRLELPTGSTLQDLVPAVGGGFRGLVRSGDKAVFSGHARLVPVSAGATGVGLALGPLVGLMALSVGAEMLARHQQDQKLAAIQRGVAALNNAVEETTQAQLQSAEQALESASAAILDRIEVPSAIGLGTARDNLRVIKNRGLGWLSDWEDRLQRFHGERDDEIDYGKMREVLAGKDSGDAYRAFPNRVATFYRAITLDSRAIVLTDAEAALRRDNASLGHLQAQLHSQLAANAVTQDRLRDLLWRLTSVPVTYSSPALPTTSGKVHRLQQTLNRLAIASAQLPDAPGLLTTSNRQVTEILRRPNGDLHVLAARTGAA